MEPGWSTVVILTLHWGTAALSQAGHYEPILPVFINGIFRNNADKLYNYKQYTPELVWEKYAHTGYSDSDSPPTLTETTTESFSDDFDYAFAEDNTETPFQSQEGRALDEPEKTTVTVSTQNAATEKYFNFTSSASGQLFSKLILIFISK